MNENILNTFISTREYNPTLGVDFKTAMLNPSAPLGGLYTFQTLPHLSEQDILSLSKLSYKALCIKIFELLGLGIDDATLRESLKSYELFDDPNNPAPLVQINEKLHMLNLFSGPTRAFKDMALQPFGSLLSLFAAQSKTTYLILVATSGDTGPATLQSFANKPYIKVICFYPYKGTSDVQRLQMSTQEASNCKVIGIRGNFDDAQNTLKSLLNNTSFIQQLKTQGIALSAANSVNIGRIAFQMVYYFWAYIHLLKNKHLSLGEKLSIVVPSGNFGNILGAFLAKKIGLPLGTLVVASNTNNILSDFINTGIYDISTRTLIKTKSPAMDILKSSNVERVLHMLFGPKRTASFMQSLSSTGSYQLNEEELQLLQTDFKAIHCDDSQSLQGIAEAAKNDLVLDPHSAIAYYGATKLQQKGQIDKTLFVSTAEWSKFAPSVSQALSQAGLIQTNFTKDEQAIKEICVFMNTKVSQHIYELFNKKEIHTDVMATQDISSYIIQWLKLK